MKFTVATVLAMLATITVAAPAGDSNFASPVSIYNARHGYLI